VFLCQLAYQALTTSSQKQTPAMPVSENHSAVLQNTESRSFHERFLDTWLTFKARFRNENFSTMEASSTATLRTITCSDSSQHIRHCHMATTSCATTHNRPNQAQASGSPLTFPPPCQPPVHPGPRYPSSPNSIREYYSSLFLLRMDSRERNSPSTARRSHPSDTTPRPHTVLRSCIRRSVLLAFMMAWLQPSWSL
jgi:hypothetical protein